MPRCTVTLVDADSGAKLAFVDKNNNNLEILRWCSLIGHTIVFTGDFDVTLDETQLPVRKLIKVLNKQLARRGYQLENDRVGISFRTLTAHERIQSAVEQTICQSDLLH